MNPFDDENGTFTVVAGSHGRLALWPGFAPLPAGWTVLAGPASRAECLAEVERRCQPAAARPGPVA